MANQEHLEILRQGVDVWNKWRNEYLDIQPDLSKTNLSNSDLSRADLSKTIFSGANLSRVNLSGANLKEARLKGVDLQTSCLNKTNLGKCHLYRANLRESDLKKANLNRADLRKACFRGANLYRTDLSQANLSEANLSQADLREANLYGATFNKCKLRETDLSDSYLIKSNLLEANLYGANLSRATLSGANLHGANLHEANLKEANLSRAYLYKTNLIGANFSNADLSEANLSRTCLEEACLNKANLTRANLTRATLVNTDLTETILSSCCIHGIAVWNVRLKGAMQDNLIITPEDEPIITVDNLEVAQFIYLLLNNQRIRHVTNTITSKVVLILGRFSVERKPVLDSIRNELRNHNYLPVLFDFEKPDSRDLAETISTLAHLARFIIIDLTDPSSAPHEIATIVPQCIVPVQPLLLQEASRDEYAMFSDLRQRYHWVLPTYHYLDTPSLLASLKEHLIIPAEKKAQELEQHKQGK